MEPLESYFAAEKQASLLFIIVGSLALLAALRLALRKPAWRGALLPLVAVGILQLVVGGRVFLRTEAQVEALKVRIALNGEDFRSSEVLRMEGAMKAFRTYKAIEIGIVALGLLLVWGPWGKRNLRAAGWGWLAQGGVMLILDLLAEGRGNKYLIWLKHL